MRLVFYASDKPREQVLAEAVCRGARRHGVLATVTNLDPGRALLEADVAAMVGVKSAQLFHAVQRAGQLPLYFDKGYIRSRLAGARTWEFWRVSVGAHHPTQTTLMAHKMPHDRAEACGFVVRDWRRHGLQVVLAGSSAKYHEFYGLPDPTEWARDIIDQLRSLSDRPVVYRPKPSWKDAVPISGSTFSGGKESLIAALANAHCLVTHGSNACFEAALLGIPSIILGDAVARPISSQSLEDLAEPKMGKRQQWLANLAYHQWTESELASGEAWTTIGEWVRDYEG